MRWRSRFALPYEFWGRSRLYEPLVAAAVGPDGAALRARAVALLALRPGATALDVGTGTGLTLPLLLEAVGAEGRVVGVDRSPGMLAQARRHAPPPRLELVEADAGALPFPDDAFDGVVSTYALTAVPDPAAAVAEALRVLRPGGRLVVADVHALNWATPDRVNRAVTTLLEPFNTWRTERDIPGVLRAAGLRPHVVPTGRPALSLTWAERPSEDGAPPAAPR